MSFFDYGSQRRRILDTLLLQNINFIQGDVIDIGGKKKDSRGSFSSKDCTFNSWKYLNNDSSSNPDILADVHNLPLDDCSFDTILMLELLEYVDDINKVLKEVSRVSKINSHIIISVPLIHPVHGDDDLDKMRYTEAFLKRLFKKNNFSIIKFERMGGTSTVIYDLLRTSFFINKSNLLSRLLIIFSFLFRTMDKLSSKSKLYINTGYFFVLKKID